MRIELVRGGRAIVEVDTLVSIAGVEEPAVVKIYLVWAEDGTWTVVDY